VKNKWHRWWRTPQRWRFLLVGAFNTLFGYLVFSGLFLLFGKWVHYLAIGFVSHLIAVSNAFVAYRSLVFPSTDRWQASFIRFNLSQLVSLGFGIAGLYGLVEFGHCRPLLAQAVITALSVLLSYTLHRFFSFPTAQIRN
jgi:putative flippase GtrA